MTIQTGCRKKLTLKCGGKWQNGHMWSQRREDTVNDRCSETDMTDGEGEKGECLITHTHPQ